MAATLEKVYQKLLAHYGRPAGEAEAGSLAALLVATLAPVAAQKKQKWLDDLREAGLLDAQRLARLSPQELQDQLAPVGNARVNVPRLKSVLKLLVEQFDGAVEELFATPMDLLREQLLALNGVGPETADRVLLEAGGLPSFVVDLATQRVLKRHGWVDFEADYHAVKEYAESSMESDPTLYRELHALLARVGEEHCRKTPQCDGCPLADLLPEGGPREPESW